MVQWDGCYVAPPYGLGPVSWDNVIRSKPQRTVATGHANVLMHQDCDMNHKLAPPVAIALVAAVLIGLLLRVSDLAQNLYWVDEVHTTLRLAGHTKASVTALLQQPTTVAALAPFQGRAAPLSDTWAALVQHPEHPPLYYLLTWGWLALWRPGPDNFVALLRWPGLLAGLLVIPATYWFSWELWAKEAGPSLSRRLGLAATLLITLSPLHVLYAQEAREYSLWTLLVLLSGAMLLRSRRRGGYDWVGYSLTVMLGLYSHLLFTVVALAQGLYLLGSAPKLRRSGWLAIAAGVVAFLPWVGVGLWQRQQLANVASAVQREITLGRFIDLWARNLNRVFFNGDWGAANLLIALLAAYSFYVLWRTHRRCAGLITLTALVPAVALLLLDVTLGGTSSVRPRYLIPVYLGVQLAIAYALAAQVIRHRGWPRRVWSGLLALVLVSSGAASLLATQTPVSWVKSDKAVHYPAMATAINASPGPWVLSDSSATYLLALSRLLNPGTRLQLVEATALPPQPAGTVFLFDPSAQLKRAVRQRYGALTLRVEQNPRFQLLQVSQRRLNKGEN